MKTEAIQNTIDNINNLGYYDILENDDLWNEIAERMGEVANDIPFDQSFDEYAWEIDDLDEWFNNLKPAFVIWLEQLNN